MPTYTWTLEQILEEERRLRRLAEEQVRAYRRLLASLARDLDPDLVDAHRRTDPRFPDSLDVDGWQALFVEIQTAQRAEERGWNYKTDGTTAGSRRQTAGSQKFVGSDVSGRRREGAPTAEDPEHFHPHEETTSRRGDDTTNRRGEDATNRRGNEEKNLRANKSPPAACRLPSAGAKRPSPANRQLPSAAIPPPAACRLPSAAVPSRYARLFQDWEREGLVLQLLASTGWSLRHAIDETVAGQLGIGVGSGSIKRLFRRLEKNGLVASQVHT
ncbi:MAG: hypothetical protein D6790_13825, partial [Caldilineae bacterium]